MTRDPEPEESERGRSILFVCAGNTCRSLMAAAFARARFGDGVVVDSAGLRPQSAAEAAMAIDTMQREFGIDASGHRPKGVADIDLDGFSRIVAMDPPIAAVLRHRTARVILVWDVADPWRGDCEAYSRCAHAIERLVAQL